MVLTFSFSSPFSVPIVEIIMQETKRFEFEFEMLIIFKPRSLTQLNFFVLQVTAPLILQDTRVNTQEESATYNNL